MDSLCTDYSAGGLDLYVNVAHSAVGNEGAVFDSTESSVGQAPCGVGGHIHGIAVGVDSVSAEGVACAGGEVVVIGFDLNVVQLTGGAYVRNDEYAVEGGTLSAVAGNGTHGDFCLTGALGDET